MAQYYKQRLPTQGGLVMKSKKLYWLIAVVVVLLCVVAVFVWKNKEQVAEAEPVELEATVGDITYSKVGPKAKEILFPIYVDDEARILALLRGDVDVYPGLTKPAEIKKVQEDENVHLTMDLGFHMFYIGLNTGKYPTSEKAIRYALSHVVDRDKIILNLFEGFMLPLDSLVPQSSNYYYDQIAKYEYDPKKAEEILDEAGFTMGPNGIRIDPKTGKELEKFEFLTPLFEVAPTSAEIGKMIAQEANKIGLPLVATPLDFNVILDKLDTFDFQMYALAWGLSREPDHLYGLFHSKNAVEGGDNTTQTKDPEIDKALEELLYATNRDDFTKASNKAQELLAIHQPYIVLYSRPYMNAFRTDKVKGFIPMKGYGSTKYQNFWTTLNLEPIEGDKITWLLPNEPQTFNMATASSAYDWQILGRINDSPFAYDAETLEDVPNWVTKATEEVWTYVDDEGNEEPNAAKVTYKMRKDVKWHDGEDFKASDVKFTIEYLRDNKVPRYLGSVNTVVKVETPDDYTVVVYSSTPGFLHLYDIQGLPWLPEHIWKDVTDWKGFQPWKESHPTVEGLTKLIGIGPFVFKEYNPGEYVRLERFEDYWRLKL